MYSISKFEVNDFSLAHFTWTLQLVAFISAIHLLISRNTESIVNKW
jgi:hypothetical protein